MDSTERLAQRLRSRGERLVRLAPKAPLMMEIESVTERAAWNIQLGTADLFIAVLACETTDEALMLSRVIQDLGLAIAAAQSAALLKADELSGASR